MFYQALSCQYIDTLNMLNQNKFAHQRQALSTMGITQWRLRDAMYTSPLHHQCCFMVSLIQPLTSGQKTFLVKLYQAIEKLLKLDISENLIQSNIKNIESLDTTKVKLIFKHKILLPEIREKSPALIIDLPDVRLCEKTPAIKSTLWKILKENIS